MAEDSIYHSFTEKLEPFFNIVKKIIYLFAFISGAAVFVMIGITVADVTLRIFGFGITGAYDVVRIAGAVAISFALPYVTAVKGHIAIEFFYHSFSKTGRVILDSSFRIVTIVLLVLLVQRNFLYFLSLRASGQVMPTLGVPVFWIPLLIGLSFILVCITVFYHLLHPGKEMIKP